MISCQIQSKSKELKNMEKYNLNLSLLFYPSMSIESIIYSVDIINDSLIVKKNHIGNKMEYRIKLTGYQYTQIRKKISAINQKYNHLDDDWEHNGAWGCTLKINNQIYYESNFFSFVPQPKRIGWQAPPEEIKLLIDYIVSLSPIPIELYGFS